MHEVGIICSMLDTIRGIMREENLTHVEKIVLEVGELSGVVPKYMEDCFPAAVYKTEFQDTKMEMIVIPGMVRCEKCGMEFNGYRYDLTCPNCSESTHLTRLSGEGLTIKEIHAC